MLWPHSPELEARRKDVVAFLCPWGPGRLDGKRLDQFPSLKVVSNDGVGYDHIDISACSARGIKVGNTPDVLVDTVADMAFALLLASARRVREGDIIARDPSTSSLPENWFGYEVSNSTLGIIGMGRIGTKIAKRSLGFNIKILYNDIQRQTETVEKALSAEYHPSLREMLPKCDFVVLVVPGTKENDKMFSTEEFAAMKKTAVLVNIGRGSTMDQEALVAALTNGTIAAAGIDVTSPEPLPRDHPLLKLTNLTITPHMGASTLSTRQKMVQIVVENAICALEGKPLRYEVTETI